MGYCSRCKKPIDECMCSRGNSTQAAPKKVDPVKVANHALVEYLRECRGMGIAEEISCLTEFTDMCAYEDEMNKVMDLLFNLAEAIQEAK